MRLMLLSFLLCSCVTMHREYFPGTKVKLKSYGVCADTGIVLGHFNNEMYLVQIECDFVSHEMWFSVDNMLGEVK